MATGNDLSIYHCNITANENCYDLYWCDDPQLASLSFHLLGWFSSVLIACTLCGNIFLLPTLHSRALSTNASTIYSYTIGVGDMLYVLIHFFIITSCYLYNDDYEAQLEYYRTKSLEFIPLGLPFLEYLELNSTWLVVFMLADRYVFLTSGMHSKTIATQTLAIKLTVLLGAMNFVYAIPKMLRYQVKSFTLNETENAVYPHRQGKGIHSTMRVVCTDINENYDYYEVMTHHLCIPIEHFLPLTACLTLVLMCLYVLSSDKLYRVGSDITFTKNKEPFSSDSPEPEKKPRRKCVFHVSSKREYENVYITVTIGIALLLCKFPKFLHHIWATEKSTIKERAIQTAYLIVRLLNISFVTIKPIAFFAIGKHYRRAVLRLICPVRSDGRYNARHDLSSKELLKLDQEAELDNASMEDLCDAENSDSSPKSNGRDSL